LDRDQKLDILFGPEVAQRLRLLAQTVHDVRTTPAGRIPGSDSIPRMMAILEAAHKIPVLGHGATMAVGAWRAGRALFEIGKAGREAREAARTPIAEQAARVKAPSLPRRIVPARVVALGGTQASQDAKQ
jgi:hypothetical protein